MHRKATTMGDEASAALILEERDPARVKALGRRIDNFDPSRWKKYASQWGEQCSGSSAATRRSPRCCSARGSGR